MTTSDNDDQPLGERPDTVLDLSFDYRDGRHVPFTLRIPHGSEEQYRDIDAQLVAAREQARAAIAKIDAAWGDAQRFTDKLLGPRRQLPSTAELVLLAATLFTLAAVVLWIVAGGAR